MRNCRLFWVLLLSLIALGAWAQETSIQKCYSILAKTSITVQDFAILDSLLFSINYYNSENVEDLYRDAIKRAKAEELPHFFLHFEILLADLFYEKNMTDSSVFHIENVATQSEETNNQLFLAKTSNLRRLNLTKNNNFAEASRLCFEALETFEKLGNLSGMGVANRDIGSILLLEEKYNSALPYCLRSATQLEKTNNWYELTFTYQRIGIIYRNLGEYESAHKYILMSMDACRKLSGFRASQGLAKKFWTQGYIYQKERKYENAMSSFDSCKYYANLIGYHDVDRSINSSLGSIFLERGEYKEAKNAFLTALQNTRAQSQTQNAYDYYAPLYANLVKAHEGLKDYENAYFYLKKIDQEKDSIFKLSSEKQIAELHTKYETRQKEDAILQLELDKGRQQKLIALATFLICSLLILAFLLWRNVKAKKVINSRLISQKQIIESKNKQNELLLREIHHRVKNNLQTISSLLSLQSESINDEVAFDAIEESKNRVRSMALIHQKLYQGENLASIEMKNYFQTMGGAIIESFGEKAAGVELKVEMEEMDLDVDAAIPIGLIANELMTNSLKYAFDNNQGEIKISLKKLDDEISEMTISDNGSKANLASNKVTENGFGTMLVQLLTQQLSGQLNIRQIKAQKLLYNFHHHYNQLDRFAHRNSLIASTTNQRCLPFSQISGRYPICS